MKRTSIAGLLLLLLAGLGAPVRADILFYETFDTTSPGPFNPAAPTGGDGQQFYLPNDDANIVVRPADKLFKTNYLSFAANPKLAYDAMGVTTRKFAFPNWKNYIVGWEGVFPVAYGINHQSDHVNFGVQVGHYYALGGLIAQNGKLYVDLDNGKRQYFASYQRGVPHGFIYVIDTSSSVKKLRITFAQNNELQSSPWITMPDAYEPPKDPDYMTMLIWLPDSQKPGDTSKYYLDKISINGNFPR